MGPPMPPMGPVGAGGGLPGPPVMAPMPPGMPAIEGGVPPLRITMLVCPPASGHVSAHTDWQFWSQACVGPELLASAEM